ncbi:MAG: aminotransferase class I/II-fold pyridoxal phosphate-dependent enzyme [Gemmataceae bacterium]|nr:aminotransferase class I/II-fold pyridoxal phosphate-dependent enzyme [Gemmataceae bacterium]MDW8242933.1 aminotransferase class I/II-fold pyridoxal phosphate-dependent enzyme [Thermogemmata sp.]
MDYDRLLAERSWRVEASGIRRIFELAKSLPDPIDLSIGQPDFDVPEPIKAAAQAAIAAGYNGYTLTQGIPELRERLLADVQRRFPHQQRQVLITSGTSGGIFLAFLALVNPGDEVITTDPYFVAYPNHVALVGGRLVLVDTYPDFQLDPDRLAAAISPRTKAIVLSTPANPTGVALDAQRARGLVEVAQRHNLVVISDEIYRGFYYEGEPVSPAQFGDNVLVVEGFGKTYGMTGWRLGWVHGPARLIEEMAKLQQFTYVCAPSIAQWAALTALETDTSAIRDTYRRKRDLMLAGLRDCYELVVPQGAFYLFPKAPGGDATAFVSRAIQNRLLIIPGKVFSSRDTHFRLSYAAPDALLQRGIDVLRRLAGQQA